jgi:hypothetical protein
MRPRTPRDSHRVDPGQPLPGNVCDYVHDPVLVPRSGVDGARDQSAVFDQRHQQLIARRVQRQDQVERLIAPSSASWRRRGPPSS